MAKVTASTILKEAAELKEKKQELGPTRYKLQKFLLALKTFLRDVRDASIFLVSDITYAVNNIFSKASQY